MPQKVKILNPYPGEAEYTSPNRARRYLKKGRAVAVSEWEIRFLSPDEVRERGAAALATARNVRMSAMMVMQARRQNVGYDDVVRTRTLNRREAKHLPFVGNVGLLGLAH